jgi:RNA 3'-terminal phosphate cyclase (ATP)
MLEIDGSVGEGGGQVLRTSLTLSAIMHTPFKMTNIRTNRSPPGLQPQHLMSTLSAQKICNGQLQGAELLSKELTFYPGTIIGGNYNFDIGTAGSTILVLQTLLPILLFAKKKSTITIIGGTHLPKSPSYDYFERIFLPAINRFGVFASVHLIRSGYYPRGGGEVVLSIIPSTLKGCSDWETDQEANAIIRLGKLPSHIAFREQQVLFEANFKQIEIYEEDTLSQGNSLTLWRGFKGMCILGERGKRAEIVASEACRELAQESGSIDVHLADQLLLYAALAKGETHYSTSRFSDHLLTHVYVISKFLHREIILEDLSVTVKT